jgi:uncharacterized small protein (DUF1192 family)
MAEKSLPRGNARPLTGALSAGELKQRVAVLKRFKELLKAQRDRFSAYLNALDKQQDVIKSGSADDLLHHVELEEKIVADIFSIQKVIDPLEKMYQPVTPEPSDEVASLKEALEGLKVEAVVRSERNKELLARRMAELRTEIKTLRANPYNRRGHDTAAAPTQIDIRG